MIYLERAACMLTTKNNLAFLLGGFFVVIAP